MFDAISASSQTTVQVVMTVAVVGLAFFFRTAGRRLAGRMTWASEAQARRVYAQIRLISIAVGVLGVVMIWAEELRGLALSLVAVAAALVIATKELIASITGSIVRASTGSFQIGDRIRIGDVRGDVIDHSLMQTTLLEIDDAHIRTGRTVAVPNAALLTQAVANETQGNPYVIHNFTVPVRAQDWHDAESTLLTAAQELTAPYIDEVRHVMTERARRHALPVPPVEPMILAKATSPETIELTVRMPAAAREMGAAEDAVTRAWLARAGSSDS